MSSHKPIRIYMILGVNTLYRLFCFFKLFPMVGKGLTLTAKYAPETLPHARRPDVPRNIFEPDLKKIIISCCFFAVRYIMLV